MCQNTWYDGCTHTMSRVWASQHKFDRSTKSWSSQNTQVMCARETSLSSNFFSWIDLSDVQTHLIWRLFTHYESSFSFTTQVCTLDQVMVKSKTHKSCVLEKRGWIWLFWGSACLQCMMLQFKRGTIECSNYAQHEMKAKMDVLTRTFFLW